MRNRQVSIGLSVVTVVAILVLIFGWEFGVEKFVTGFVFSVESKSLLEITFASGNIVLYALIQITAVLALLGLISVRISALLLIALIVTGFYLLIFLQVTGKFMTSEWSVQPRRSWPSSSWSSLQWS